MENKSLRFYAIMALWVVLFVLLFVSNRRVDLKTDINKSTTKPFWARRSASGCTGPTRTVLRSFPAS